MKVFTIILFKSSPNMNVIGSYAVYLKFIIRIRFTVHNMIMDLLSS